MSFFSRESEEGNQNFFDMDQRKNKRCDDIFSFFFGCCDYWFCFRSEIAEGDAGSDNGLCLWHFLLDLGDLLLAASQNATGHKQTNSDAETESKQNPNPNKLHQIESNSK